MSKSLLHLFASSPSQPAAGRAPRRRRTLAPPLPTSAARDLLAPLRQGGRLEREAGLAAQLASRCRHRHAGSQDATARQACHFGSASGSGRPMSGLAGTPYYVAPEVVAGGVREKVGGERRVVLYMMLSGKCSRRHRAEIFEVRFRGNLLPPRASRCLARGQGPDAPHARRTPPAGFHQ
ncbi:hypothetical protein ZWY2020_059464 [Hordeum vulgare]|nr:hypothetical protein ZWY2020_059464 [Hordeum vulgare]